MIHKLLQITQLGEKLKTPKLAHFNNTLPLLIEVLKKTKHQHYLLRVGKQTLETKSLRELEIGGRYFAIMKHSSLGNIMISSLKKEPKLPQSFLEFSLQEWKSQFKSQSLEDFQKTARDQMRDAKTSEEFMKWGFFLLGLQKQIVSFWIKDEEKKTFLQFRSRKNRIDFYALLPHLGEIEGKILRINEDQIHLELHVMYDSVASFLSTHQASLEGIDALVICVKDWISPLFLPQDHLLNLKI